MRSFQMSQPLINKFRRQVRESCFSLSLLFTVGVKIVLILLWFDRAQGKTIKPFAGPFIAFTRTFDTCPSDNTGVMYIRPSHFNPSRPYELQVLSGNVTFREDVMDNYVCDNLLKTFQSQVSMAVRSNNQWKENYFVLNFPKVGCSAIRDQVPDLYRMLAKKSGASMDKSTPCRIPAGVWQFRNEPVNWSFPNFPIMPYGRYKYRVSARSLRSQNSRMLCFCSEIDCEIIPRP